MRPRGIGSTDPAAAESRSSWDVNRSSMLGSGTAALLLATAHLLREAGERRGDLAIGVVCEYAFTRSGRLRGGNGAGHHGLEDAVRLPVLASDGAFHVPGEVVAGVVERDEDALHGEAGVYLPPDPRHGLQEAGHAGCREVLGGDRDEDAVRGGQCVDGDYSQGGRAVDDDVVVVRLDGREPGAHHPLAGHRHEHRHLHGGELDVGGHEVDALAVAEHTRRGVVVRARYRGRKVGGEGRLKRVRVPPSEGLRQVSLGIGVDEKHPAPRPAERDPQAQRRGGLGRPSLLVGDGYRPACHLASSHLRRCRVSGGQEVSISQSGAGPCRPAAFGRPSARSRISFGNGRPHAEYAVEKRGNWTGISSVSPVSQTHPTEGA